MRISDWVCDGLAIAGLFVVAAWLYSMSEVLEFLWLID